MPVLEIGLVQLIGAEACMFRAADLYHYKPWAELAHGALMSDGTYWGADVKRQYWRPESNQHSLNAVLVLFASLTINLQ